MSTTLHPVARVFLRRPMAKVVLARFPLIEIRRAVGSVTMTIDGVAVGLKRLLGVAPGTMSISASADARVLYESGSGYGIGSMTLGDSGLG